MLGLWNPHQAHSAAVTPEDKPSEVHGPHSAPPGPHADAWEPQALWGPWLLRQPPELLCTQHASVSLEIRSLPTPVSSIGQEPSVTERGDAGPLPPAARHLAGQSIVWGRLLLCGSSMLPKRQNKTIYVYSPKMAQDYVCAPAGAQQAPRTSRALTVRPGVGTRWQAPATAGSRGRPRRTPPQGMWSAFRIKVCSQGTGWLSGLTWALGCGMEPRVGLGAQEGPLGTLPLLLPLPLAQLPYPCALL